MFYNKIHARAHTHTHSHKSFSSINLNFKYLKIAAEKKIAPLWRYDALQ